MSISNFSTLPDRLIRFLSQHPKYRFGFLWLFVFIIYLPAAKAGFVADFSGWLQAVRYDSFSDFVNRTHFVSQSLYQLTQFNCWVLYHVLGANEWLWHLLFVTIHTINCFLMYRICDRLMADGGIRNSAKISFGGVLLYCLSPYLSETIVWEPSFHFLQGFLLILLVLDLAYKFVTTRRRKYLILGLGTYFLSTFSLEIFYVTPLLVLLMGIYLQGCVSRGSHVLTRIMLYFFLPMAGLFLVHLCIFRALYGGWVAHIGTGTITGLKFTAFGKPLKYLFHLVFLGRFMSHETRDHVYDLCSSMPAIACYLSLTFALLVYWLVRLRSISPAVRFAGLLFGWMTLCLGMLIPLWFQELQLVQYDRYLYFSGAFFYLLLTFVLSNIKKWHLGSLVFLVFALVNFRFTIQVNRYWGKSARVINRLFHTLPAAQGKTLLLLDLPQNLQGVAMIGAEKNSEFKLLHDLIVPDSTLKETVFDCLAYNMNTPDDGVHVRVLDDSTVLVTLNQWGSWWWFATMGAVNYSNEVYGIELKEGGATGGSYVLHLKQPSSNCMLLFSTGGRWKTVDMGNKAWDQY